MNIAIALGVTIFLLATAPSHAMWCKDRGSVEKVTRPFRMLWTSLDRPPSIEEAREISHAKVEFAEFNVTRSSPDVMHLLRDGGVSVFAYNIGDGGGPAWGEPQNILMAEGADKIVYAATIEALRAGASGLHLDNVHAIDELRLEAFMDAQVRAATELGHEPALHLKNATDTYLRILKRRPDLRTATKVAVVEHLMSQADSARAIAKIGIPVFGIEFSESRFGSPTATLEDVGRFTLENPWIAGIWSLPNEDAYEGRSGVLVTPTAICTE